jgi:hypothetical protein
VYVPQQNVSVDEELVLFRGRVMFRQYMPAKKARCGIKIYCMCEAASGYVSNFLIHSTREENRRFADGIDCADLTLSEKVVVEACRKQLDLGYHIYCDSWFTSMRLAQFLLQRSTLLIGTVRVNRGIPNELRQAALPQQDCAFMRKGDLLAVKLVTRKASGVKTVYFLDTKNAAGVRIINEREQPLRQLVTAADYNLSMRGVDRLDAALQPYDCSRKSLKWFVKLGQHFFQMLVRNGWVVYRSCGGRLSYRKFLETVVNNFVTSTGRGRKRMLQAARQPGRQRHSLKRLPPTEAQRRPTKRCRQCKRAGRRKKKTVFCCATCPGNPGLCAVPCFDEYHEI